MPVCSLSTSLLSTSLDSDWNLKWATPTVSVCVWLPVKSSSSEETHMMSQSETHQTALMLWSLLTQRHTNQQITKSILQNPQRAEAPTRLTDKQHNFCWDILRHHNQLKVSFCPESAFTVYYCCKWRQHTVYTLYYQKLLICIWNKRWMCSFLSTLCRSTFQHIQLLQFLSRVCIYCIFSVFSALICSVEMCCRLHHPNCFISF